MIRRTAVTIRDVARRAGVSAGTVSRVITDHPGISEPTRRRVRDAVAELRYTPNLAARRLSTGRHLAIAVIVPFFTRTSVTERLNGAARAFSSTPYDLVIHNVETREERAACYRRIPHRGQADGVLIFSLSPRDEEEVATLLAAEVPVVLIDADHPQVTAVPRVTVDDVAGGEMATKHLLDLGHERVGFVGDAIDDPFHINSSRDRLRGYRRAMEAAGIAPPESCCAHGPHSRAEARRLASRVLSQPDRPTAVVAASDTQAIGVLEAARDVGLRVPDQLSVVGYDDVEIAEIANLTTVRLPLFRSGQRGAELLIEAVRGEMPQAGAREVLPVELVVRGTTAPPSTSASPVRSHRA